MNESMKDRYLIISVGLIFGMTIGFLISSIPSCKQLPKVPTETRVRLIAELKDDNDKDANNKLDYIQKRVTEIMRENEELKREVRYLRSFIQVKEYK